MKHHIVLLAGGMGTRLNNTEKMPKPLVDINGLSLISRIIFSLNETNLFKQFHILTCINSEIFEEILSKEINNLNYRIYTEKRRTGRIGALKFFLKSQDNIEKFFVCNADTIIFNLVPSEIKEPINQFKYNPIVFLASADSSREDYKKITIKVNDDFINYQNSGLVYISREWFNQSVNANEKFNDIDEYLFSKTAQIEMFSLSSCLLDAGTPDRLHMLRKIYK